MSDPFPEDLATERSAWLSRAACRAEDLNLRALTPDRFVEIIAHEGVDLATALIFDHILKRPRNAAFQGTVHRQLFDAPREDSLKLDLIGVVPGAFHGQHKHTGADGLKMVETMQGIAPRIEVIPVRSFGPLEENAKTILDWLVERRGKRIALASLSKGGADLKKALASPHASDAFTSVVSWVSFSGIVQGTPLVDWLRQRRVRSAAFRLLLKLQGHRSAVLDELRRGQDAPLWDWPEIPAHLRVVHVNGFPLRHHLRHRWAPRGYERVLGLGPNDGGGILLSDLLRLPGVVFPIWGTDHYLQPRWDIAPLLRAIMVTSLSEREWPRQASQSEIHPSATPARRSTA